MQPRHSPLLNHNFKIKGEKSVTTPPLLVEFQLYTFLCKGIEYKREEAGKAGLLEKRDKEKEKS